ncbi:mevalonate kinase [Candidatus Micrarchaeota archaeon]|nr:mevalonate kinase [Candidatus Micrarchaeota archaeon]
MDVVTTSAPGKAFLFGEHAVVHGEPALAIAISTRSFITMQKRADSKVNILAKDLSIRNLQVSYGERGVEFDTDYSSVQDALAFVRLPMQAAFADAGKEIGLDITTTSDLLAGTGLGSSASISVATALAASEMMNLGWDNNKIFEVCRETKFKVERGAASATDISLATFGGVCLYRKSNKGDTTEKIENAPPLPLVIGYSGTAGKSEEMVRHVMRLREKYPEEVSEIIRAIGRISLRGAKAVAENNLAEVGELMNINQGLLDALGVNTLKLSELIYAARQARALGAKISGAGGGKCMICLAPEQELVKSAIEMYGGTPIVTSISKDGARVEKHKTSIEISEESKKVLGV